MQNEIDFCVYLQIILSVIVDLNLYKLSVLSSQLCRYICMYNLYYSITTLEIVILGFVLGKAVIEVVSLSRKYEIKNRIFYLIRTGLFI